MAFVLLLSGCRTDATSSPSSTTPLPPSTSTRASTSTSASATATDAAVTEDLVRARPYRLEAPRVDAGPMPLVILLHGYGSSGANHDTYFALSAITRARGMLLAIPDGTRDHKGMLYWNASEACCDFDKVPVDDVAYLDAIIDDVAKQAPLDASRVYIIGHSNGAFMAHRYACERSARVAAIVALAGVPWSDASRCTGHNVSVLQVHGDADRVIEYAGGKSFGNGEPYPSAEAAVAAWAERDRCGARHNDGAAVDFDLGVPGVETTREAYDCPTGVDVALWHMHGSAHVPRMDARFANAALDFLAKHHK